MIVAGGMLGILAVPSNPVASRFGFEREEFFELEAPETERKPVKVGFSQPLEEPGQRLWIIEE
ncbi:MAG: hypothetical protein M1497_03555 [Nitrospirae bacterium]|nr:hypothetical protein [Nitrospirota bacterium]